VAQVVHVRVAAANAIGGVTDFHLVTKDGAVDGWNTMLVMVPELKVTEWC
jgi:hypothetical protein